MAERIEVQRAIATDPSAIFRVLCDPKGHVAIDSSGMLMAATGDPVTGVGDSFVVHMDREALSDYPLGLYDVTVEIVTFDPDREIAWRVRGQLDLGHVYGYRLQAIDDGTLVTSYYDWSAVDQSWKDAAIFPVIPEGALRATLGILARTVAPGRPRPEGPAREGKGSDVDTTGTRVSGETDAAGAVPPSGASEPPASPSTSGPVAPPPAAPPPWPAPPSAPGAPTRPPPPAPGPYGPAPPARTEPFAVVSLVASIGAVFFCFIGSIVGIVFGHLARSRIRRSHDRGAGLALAGLIVGYTGLAIAVVAVAVVAAS